MHDPSFLPGAEHLLAFCALLTGSVKGRARLVGGRWDGVVCHSRSGAFGDDGDLLAMWRAVTGA